MVCASSSTKTRHLTIITLSQISITLERISCVFFDTVCSMFFNSTFVYAILTLIGRTRNSTQANSLPSLCLPMFLFWFCEWIISIFMSFQHMFSIFFSLFICFVFVISFVYLCFSLSTMIFFLFCMTFRIIQYSLSDTIFFFLVPQCVLFCLLSVLV